MEKSQHKDLIYVNNNHDNKNHGNKLFDKNERTNLKNISASLILSSHFTRS